MKKICLPLLAMLLLWSNFSHAQQNPTKKKSTQSNTAQAKKLTRSGSKSSDAARSNVRPDGLVKDRCGYQLQFNKAVAAGYNKAAFESVISQKVKEIQAARANGTARFANYRIPVVFHIIHDGTAEGVGANLSAAQVYQQIDQLNKDFGNQSGSPFPQAADAGITFCPVTVNEAGVTLAQPGINRINRITRGWTDPTTYTDEDWDEMTDYIDGTIKPATIWDPTRFVNIWAYDFSASQLLGYATFPTAGLPGLPAGETATTAGCVFLSGSLGSVASPGTAGDYALGRTVGHEIGHFLGLYHIWGDEDDCSGTDECADTPPCSSDYYSGYPTCTAPVECSGQVRMIQNYMDYSDDGCMNTYTQNQVDRMQAVMLTAPRRPSNSGLCAAPIANALNFSGGPASVTETGLGITCPKFRDYQVSVKPYTAASGNATVNFSFAGSATQNIDYSIVGASSVSYVNGESASKSITIRIIDDAVVEPSENIIISYSIVGTGLVTTSETRTIVINDDDFLQSVGSSSMTLFTQNFGTTTGSNQLPTGWEVYNYESTTNKWAVNSAGASTYGFTGNTLHITDGNNASINNGTAPIHYTTPATETDAVAFTPLFNASNFKNINVSFKLICNGEIFNGTIYDYGLVYYTLDGENYTSFSGRIQGITTLTTLSLNLPASVVATSTFGLAFQWVNDDVADVQPPFAIDDIVVTGQPHVGVETVAGQNVFNTQSTGQSAQYISGTGNIIATLTNPNQNIGCITASVSEAGNERVEFSTIMNSYFRSSKIIQLTPATANTTATYQATFYFTTAELAVWGPNAPNLKLMKVSDASPMTPGAGVINPQIVSAVFNDQRSTAGYASYTASFTGGFSKFMLVEPLATVPVTTLNFEARPSGKNIQLNWSTSAEINNKGFVVERSTNGTSFTKIGWVDGALNSSQLKNYSYADNFVQPNTVYYYRLRQTDIDARESLSDIKNARVTDRSGVLITISPNPAKNQLKVFAAGTTGLSNINMIDAKGQLVQSWKQVNCATAPQTLDISKIAAGVYLLQIINDGVVTTEKVIIN